MSVPKSPSSEYSLLSSLEVLSISSGEPSRRSSSSISPTRANFDSARRTSIDEQEYEHVFGISVSPSPSSVSIEASSSTDSLSVSESTALSKKSSSAKRRERKKKLIAGERERAALGIPSTRVFGSVSTRENLPSLQSPLEVPPPRTPKSKIGTGFYTDGHQQTPIAGLSTPCPLPNTEFEKDLSENNDNNDDDKENDEIGPIRRKTRRGGKRVRRRLENRGLAKEASEVDDELDATLELDSIADDDTASPTSSARTSVSGTPIKVTVSRLPEPEEEVDEVDGLSALESELGTPSSKRFKGRRDVMSAEDAASSIDSFLSDPRNFMTIKANKLRLWQSLCIELGLVTLQGDELPDLPTVVCVPTPPRPRETTPEPPQPFRPVKHPLPESLTQARKLLKDHAHVNLVDYLEARKYCPPAYVGAYQGLLYPSTSAMKRYTRHQGKFAEKLVVRSEWLEPLMKDFGVRKFKGGM
ncbi:hypothetical protein I203_101130 [Kwoniella mangroviensis CBS 8507]|uniref:uncharacterized protein n=1 Tax=Kwoniella mangroviensis CBS 8507 TaxID=1296122 RepID=UPI00080D122F|nr:uncharacterized protein I203_02764 [Kwoniella mangroviensis CBS 8507]OCF68104.1 hypothetical protein I203_02764 [Kwoniella mangroviensis CBS 8507]